MNISKQAARHAVLAALVLISTSVSAIEGLQISVKCPDVILSWPSISGENYIVQWRPTLDPSTPWVTLTNSLPADWTTNWTTFVDSNRVQCASGGTNNFSGGGGELPPTPNSATRLASTASASEPMVKLADGFGSAVPLCIYPPGFDLSAFVIFDPTTGEWTSGAGRVVSQPSRNRLQPNGPQPNDPDPQDGPPPPDPGFYQVVKDGVRIWGLTNLTGGVVLSNTVTVAFEAGNADPSNGTNVLGSLSSAALLVDGQPVLGTQVLGTSTRPWVFSLDTAFLENGDHWIQILVSWKNPDSSNNRRQYFDRWSDSVMISVSNTVYYPDWEPEIGEMDISAYFLKTACTDADWQIDLFDSSSNYVQTLSGHTTNGVIEAYWNMVDHNSVTRTNAQADPWFDAIATVADPVTMRLPRKNQKPKNWPEHGKWVIAYQDYFKFEYSANNAQKNSINKFALTAAKYGGYYLYYPQPGQTNDIGQTYPLRYQKTNHFDTNITEMANYLDHEMLRSMLYSTNSRNFYYDGHGDADYISDIPWHSLNAIDHRYRYVFLNSCNSANGKLDSAFGINGSKRFDIDYYHRTGIRPAAFMGYTTTIEYCEGGEVWHDGIKYDDTIPWQVPGFISNYLFFWDPDLMGYGLLSAIDNAKSGLPAVNGQYRENYLDVHGYFNLHIDEVNHRWDTW